MVKHNTVRASKMSFCWIIKGLKRSRDFCSTLNGSTISNHRIKKQSKQWKDPESQAAKKAQSASSTIKVMACVF